MCPIGTAWYGLVPCRKMLSALWYIGSTVLVPHTLYVVFVPYNTYCTYVPTYLHSSYINAAVAKLDAVPWGKDYKGVCQSAQNAWRFLMFM